MLEILNRTEFPVAIVPSLDRDGRELAIVVVKATFALRQPRSTGDGLPVAEEQVPLVWADEFHGEPDRSSMKYESDIGPEKSGTDVVLVGSAWAPGGEARQLDVTLRAGPLRKTVRVFGNRRWLGLPGLRFKSTPEPFRSMPLVYERAFGGSDLSHGDPAKHRFEDRNPIGTGFTSAGRNGHIKLLELPNLEDPENLLRHPRSLPMPAGFGFIARHWQPRRSFVGTYDESWTRDVCPLLPLDFDERHFRSAHPDLCAALHFSGGEPVSVGNASQDGELRFRVPGLRLEVETRVRGESRTISPRIDTLLIEPDERRCELRWKATFPCPRSFLYIESVAIRELERFA